METIHSIRKNITTFSAFQSGLGQNPPHFQPVMSVVQVAYRARDAVPYPY